MYKDIVVCVNEAEGRNNTIRAAARMANETNAILTGLFIRVDESLTTSSSLYGFIPDSLVEEASKHEAERATKARESFVEITSQIGCEATWVEVEEKNHPLKIIAYSDLVITDQVAYDRRQGVSNIGFINNLILQTGKPVILIPKEWDEPSFGSDIVIGWDESREASRAIQDAMPLLQKADHIEAVSVNYKENDAVVDISKISAYLTRRNVSNSFKLAITNDEFNTSGKVLLNCAHNRSANLIVVGGYGHSRLREIILGGVTRYLTQYNDIPVLFSN